MVLDGPSLHLANSPFFVKERGSISLFKKCSIPACVGSQELHILHVRLCTCN